MGGGFLFQRDGDRLTLATGYFFKHWVDFLERNCALALAHGGSFPIHIRLGITNLTDSWWPRGPLQFDDEGYAAVELAYGPGEPDVKYPRFVAGERRCPPEDVGGLPGFELFLDAMADPAHEEHGRLRDWYGAPYNADDIDERFTRRAVAAIAIRRHAGKLAYQKSRTQ